MFASSFPERISAPRNARRTPLPLFWPALALALFARTASGNDDRPTRVLNQHLHATWLESGSQFWYRSETAPGKAAFLLVDAAAGTKRPAFDHDRLAAAWGQALGTPLRPDALPLTALRYSPDGRYLFFAGADGCWRCDLLDYAVTRAEPQPATALERDPRPSRASAEPTTLTLVNRTDGELELWWIDLSGTRRGYGRLAAGQTRRQHTFIGHVWQATGRDGANLGVFEARADGAAAVFDGQLPPAPPPPPDPDRSPDGR